MAHELDRIAATGKAAMFSVRESPWHKEGIMLTEAPTMEEALELAGAGYEVGMRPVYAQVDMDNAKAAPLHRAIVRLDRGEVFGIASTDYRPVQNRDAFGVLTPLLDKGVATLETGGTLRGGRDAWMLVRFDVDDPVVREVFTDEVIPFGLVSNNHSGDARAIVMETPIRVVCANTLGFAMDRWRVQSGTGIAVSHRGDATVRLVEAAEKMFAGIVDRYRLIAESYRAMKATHLTMPEFEAGVLDVISPFPGKAFTPDGNHLTGRGYEAAYTAALDRRTAVTQAWTGGKGHVGDLSAWEAYNGGVEVIDHDANLFVTRGSRVASLLGGRLLDKKTQLHRSVMAMVGAQRN